MLLIYRRSSEFLFFPAAISQGSPTVNKKSIEKNKEEQGDEKVLWIIMAGQVLERQRWSEQMQEEERRN